MPDPNRFQTIHEIVKAARLNLNQTHWDYLVGGTETETTLKRNRSAIDTRALNPRVLNDVSKVDTSGTIIGQHLDMPVLLAPIGSVQVFTPEGGAAAAKAAAEAGIMSIASSVCEPSLEEIAAASDAPKIYQLYVRGDEKWVDDTVERAIDSGYKGFCLTVDSAVVSRRERDISKRVVPTTAVSVPGDYSYQATLNWSTVERIKEKYDIPLIVKGIHRADDAIKAVECGVDVVYISNHGGRQLDQAPGTLDLLPDIVQAIKGKAEIAIDGGFYRGTDIVKAIAMGADAVGIGRLEAWSLAAGGAPALVRCLQILSTEIRIALILCGVTSFAELDESFVCAGQAVVQPNVLSAFPLVDVTDSGY